MFRASPVAVLILHVLLVQTLFCEVIYDNTQTILSAGPGESREYGDQLFLEGTARTITELTFYYGGEFEPDGHQAMKIRLYSNETPYDPYRNAPTRLLYESGFMTLLPGLNARTLQNLAVKVPFDTLTFTIEFTGLRTNESASLLLCHPPTVGWSFNEFWRKDNTGLWRSFLYSTKDITLKANAGIRITARTEDDLAAMQADSAAALPLQSSSSTEIAQTFTPATSGRLDTVSLTFLTPISSARVELVDVTTNGAPGTNVLAAIPISSSPAGPLIISFYPQELYLAAGTLYAVQVSSVFSQHRALPVLLSCSTNNAYTSGQLWSRTDLNSSWQPASLTSNNSQTEALTNIDAAFVVSIVPAAPVVHITSPAAGEILPFGEAVPFAAELHLPAISTLYRVRFFVDDSELPQIVNPPHANPPYEDIWSATDVGPHILRVRVEDTFGRVFRSEERSVTVLPPLSSSAPRPIMISRNGEGRITLRFSTQAGERIRIEYSDDLAHWTAANTDALGTGVDLEYTDDGPPNTEPAPSEVKARFYRAVFQVVAP